MSQKRGKKRHSQAVYDARNRQKQEQLANDRVRYSGKRLNPTARNLLLGDLVLLAVVGLLLNNKLISDLTANLLSLLGIVLMIVALWFQFGALIYIHPGLRVLHKGCVVVNVHAHAQLHPRGLDLRVQLLLALPTNVLPTPVRTADGFCQIFCFSGCHSDLLVRGHRPC